MILEMNTLKVKKITKTNNTISINVENATDNSNTGKSELTEELLKYCFT